ncbi:hypothetical protein B0I31_104514 [Saccharothrix carnea]|uniref:Uncharacterized protein n=1 Tax=Saccharothrix carnea TaxID=1280637 RepID=A0A2P8ICN4_SACCR|nr:hypothetical protein [Saccharothrix carnea]PSL56223.1 hypothetical protein B0I31_104514 [Saccharothrix carnea]
MSDNRFRLRVGGDISGNVVVGDNNAVTNAPVRLDAREAEDLAALFARLRAQLGEDDDAARAKVDELEEAITDDEPDLATMESIRNWFGRKMPRLAASVSELILNPIVAKLVGAAGAGLAAEFTRRFGG